jgi:hypothetical protein
MSDDLRRALALLPDDVAFQYLVERLIRSHGRLHAAGFEFGEFQITVHAGQLAKIESRPKLRIYSNRGE